MVKLNTKIMFWGFTLLFLLSKSVCFAGSCGSGGSEGSSPWVATSVKFEDVKYCIETVAQNGDTIYIPAGTATDWVGQGASTAAMSVPDGVKVIGAGIGSTIIQTDSAFFRMNVGDNCWVEGMEFTNGAVVNWYTQEWVIKDCKFSADTVQSADMGSQNPTANEPPSGVYFGCEFYKVSLTPFGGGLNPGFYDYYPDSTWQDHVVYFENCNFDLTGDFNPLFDTHRGAGSVLRFSNVKQATLYNHGNRLNSSRAATVQGIYRNTINNTSRPGQNSAADLKSGQIIFFDNTITAAAGTNWGKVNFGLEKASDTNGSCGYTTDQGYWRWYPHPQTPLDERSFICLDSATGNDNAKNSNDLQPFSYSPTSKPWYLWNNTLNGSTAWLECQNCSYGETTLLVEGRDWFIDASAKSGYTGGMVTSGTLASAPTCNSDSEYCGHWATDQGSWNNATDDMIGYGTGNGVLYQCQETSEGLYEWVEYWRPLDYPHPLITQNNELELPGEAQNLRTE